MSVEIALFIAVAMLVGNAFFVGAEFGLISTRRSSIEIRALKGSRAAKTTLDAMEHISHMLAGAQLGVTLCSLVLGAVGEPLFAHLFEPFFETLGISASLLHPLSFVFALITMVYLHVVIGEMVPKNIALADPERAALLLIPPLVFILNFVNPIVRGLNAVANGCLRIFRVKPKAEIPSTFNRDEVAGFVEESHREGLLSEDEKHLLSGVLRFEERTVESILLPLNDTIVVDEKSTPARIEQLVAKTGFSRFPTSDNHGNLSGYIHLKDILKIDAAKQNDSLGGSHTRPLATVRAGTSLSGALGIMQHAHAHLARVTGPGGAILGIIMLEDVLEELVGEIHDDAHGKY